ncbi:MAG: hypothetical protein Kow0059_22200 [Candidatus Sumerlaeia bacterium]
MRKRAFTLIELLIVVAIIAILAAIAVPNFLEAQVRSKVSRAKSDLRSMATAIEAYIVDHNVPPREWNSSYGDPPLPQVGPGTPSGIIFPGGIRGGVLQHGISTPIAYITTGFLLDPFVRQGETIPADEQIYTYQNILSRSNGVPSGFFGSSAPQSTIAEEHRNFFGVWKMLSIGPDRTYYNNIANKTSRGGIELREHISYDPTNGTVSEGNIIRSQKHSDGEQPPIRAGLLGAH